MNNNDELERQAFESWAKANGLSLMEGRWGGYYIADTAWAWRAWQARAKQESNMPATDIISTPDHILNDKFKRHFSESHHD